MLPLFFFIQNGRNSNMADKGGPRAKVVEQGELYMCSQLHVSWACSIVLTLHYSATIWAIRIIFVVINLQTNYHCAKFHVSIMQCTNSQQTHFLCALKYFCGQTDRPTNEQTCQPILATGCWSQQTKRTR